MEDGLPSARVNEIDFTSDGTMWIATRNGVATYKNGKIEKVIKTEDGLPDNWVISLAVDKNDNIWFYTPCFCEYLYSRCFVQFSNYRLCRFNAHLL